MKKGLSRKKYPEKKLNENATEYSQKKGGGINEREPSAFIAYTYDSKTMPPMQNAKCKT